MADWPADDRDAKGRPGDPAFGFIFCRTFFRLMVLCLTPPLASTRSSLKIDAPIGLIAPITNGANHHNRKIAIFLPVSVQGFSGSQRHSETAYSRSYRCCCAPSLAGCRFALKPACLCGALAWLVSSAPSLAPSAVILFVQLIAVFFNSLSRSVLLPVSYRLVHYFA